MNCYNGQHGACRDYKSLEVGIKDFAAFVKTKKDFSEMHDTYANIGSKWYNPGDSGLGGCYYFNYIKYYMSPERRSEVSEICSRSEPCTLSGGDCSNTIDEINRPIKNIIYMINLKCIYIMYLERLIIIYMLGNHVKIKVR